MASNVVRMSPMSAPPQPSQQDWVWDGANWCPPFPSPPPCPPSLAPPFPCPPPGFPTPCPPWFPPPAGQAPWYPGANGGVSFSATPPVNPIRGNFWWDGTTLHLFDGAVWVNIGPGAGGTGGTAFVGAAPPANPAQGALWWNGTVLQVWDGTAWKAGQATNRVFALQQPNAVTVGTSSAWAIIPYTSVPSTDLQNAYDPSSHKFTPKVAGIYNFTLRGVAVGGGGIAIAMNDPGTFASVSSDILVAAASLPTTNGWMQCGAFQPMNGMTDYVRAWGWCGTNPMQSAGSSVVFSATLLP